MSSNSSPENNGSPNNRKSIYTAIILICGIGAVLLALGSIWVGSNSSENNSSENNSSGNNTSSPTPEASTSPSDTPTGTTGQISLPTGVSAPGTGYIVGDPAAPNVMVIWGDMECPACASFEERTYALVEEAISQGRLKVEYRVGGTERVGSVQSALSLGCAADQGAFKQFYLNLYANQQPDPNESFTLEDIMEIGAASGIEDLTKFRTCIEELTYYDYVVSVVEAGIAEGIEGTPTVIINGSQVTLEELGFYGFIEALGLNPDDFPVPDA